MGKSALRTPSSCCAAPSLPAIDPAHGRKIAKDKSIDGLVALAMAIGLYNREPAPLIYDFNRPLVLSV